jgi:hypothetical protein
LLLAGSLLPAGCNRREQVPVGQTEGESPRMASVVHVADPRVEQQLVSGFHAIEQNSWRWTEERFSVVLRSPRDAAQKGALLQLKFVVPEPVVKRLGAVALEASIGDKSLGKESYTQDGEFTYVRQVPPELLQADPVRVNFWVDKALPPSPTDARQLGLIVTTVGLELK